MLDDISPDDSTLFGAFTITQRKEFQLQDDSAQVPDKLIDASLIQIPSLTLPSYCKWARRKEPAAESPISDLSFWRNTRPECANARLLDADGPRARSQRVLC